MAEYLRLIENNNLLYQRSQRDHVGENRDVADAGIH